MPMSSESVSGSAASGARPEKFTFATAHSQLVQSQARGTYLSFWTYDFRDHDLFLDS